MTRHIAGRTAIAVLLLQGVAWAADPIAYITEIHRKGNGEVRVKLATDADWKVPQPLLALRPGDQLRVAGDARVVLLYHAGGATQTVSPANSPFIVTPRSGRGAGTGEKLGALLASVSHFMLGKQAPPTYRRAATRGPGGAAESPAPVILSPRHTRLLPGPVTFEWEGRDEPRYTIRVFGPHGLLWEETNLPHRPISYPPTAPGLKPDAPYRWELSAPGQPAQQTRFELLSEAQAARVRERLDVLSRTAAERGYSLGTLTVMRSAVLFEEGLYTEARRELEAAGAAEGNEPTLRFLLGHLYQQIGLTARAAQAFERARALTGE